MIFLEVIIIIAFMLIIGLPIYFVVRNNQKYREQLEQNSALAIENKAIHLSGLPATGREYCRIMVKNDGILINNVRQDFKITTDKIIGAVVSCETRDVQTVNSTTKKSPSVGKSSGGRSFVWTGRCCYWRYFR